MAEKIYVGVLMMFDQDGTKKPLGIIGEDGRKLAPNHVSQGVRLSSSKAGGLGERFACMIGRWAFYLVEENGYWYVEARA